eukprot:TRINITY_DN216_c0_g1_i1.p1 TRINITY_DN216_c0_g1~~TRINITY_DN216_c0_g1_i1.p1  ORF type:complete len:1138 (+),score=445.71 TRINITY_DN216_c0_g1_i1:44-3457(+)
MSRRRDWGGGDFGTTSSAAGFPKATHFRGVSGWHVCENQLPEGKDNHVNEALFSLSNGFIGIRGTFEEGYHGPNDAHGNAPSEQGMFVNGFYEEHIIKYPEVGFGQAQRESVMLNVINSKIMFIYVDGQLFNMWSKEGELELYYRELDLKNGLLHRDVVWTSPQGKKIRVETTRLVPLTETRKNVFVQHVTVTPLSDNIDEIRIFSDMDGHVTNKPQSKDPRVGAGFSGQVLNVEERSVDDPEFCYIKSKTQVSDLSMLCGMRHEAECDGEPVVPTTMLEGDQMIRQMFTFRVAGQRGKKVHLTKYVTYATTQDRKTEADALVPLGRRFISEAASAGLGQLKQEQTAFLERFWEVANIDILGDDLLQQGLRFNTFHLVQAVGRDGMTNIGAKGLSGEGYSGHYFWDTEIYILPFLLYTAPDIARQLVKFRISLLDKARQRALQLGGITKGALYPWRTIHGDECSAYFPAGTAQLHINADIAWAFKQYMEATDDMELLLDGGAEMLLEMARFWLEYGCFSTTNGHFQINCVTGPDEYTCLVNNNYYTNIMVQDALHYVCDIAYLLKHERPHEWKRLTDKINLEDAELETMHRAAEKMYLPYDKILGVHPQDDSFLQKLEWDFENTPHNKYPLLLHYHYLIIYKFKVIKQADLVLALLLQGAKFTDKEKKLNFDYYEPLTTHDSSLSTAVYSVIAAEIGYYQKAYNYFKCTARMDLDNIHHNSHNGIHTACMAGTWMCVVRGFAGFRVIKNVIHLNPYLPQEWKGYNCRIAFRGAVLEVRVSSRTAQYTCIKGKRVNFVHAETQRVYLREGQSKTLLLKDKFEDLTALNFDSIVIDIDVAIPAIQAGHFSSWKQVIDELKAARRDDIAAAGKLGAKEFTMKDYHSFIMNQISTDHRYSGVQLYIREVFGLDIPCGSSHDAPGLDSLWALGNKKTELLKQMIQENPPTAPEGIIRLVKELKREGIKIGLVSYSRSAETLIENSGLKRYVEAYVTGMDMGTLGLRGKPYMDMYLKITEMLFTDPSRCLLMINDPVGFAKEELSRFKLAMAVPYGHLAMEPDLDLVALEKTYLEAGVHLMMRSVDGVDIDSLDDLVEVELKKETYDDRMTRVHAECSQRVCLPCPFPSLFFGTGVPDFSLRA